MTRPTEITVMLFLTSFSKILSGEQRIKIRERKGTGVYKALVAHAAIPFNPHKLELLKRLKTG